MTANMTLDQFLDTVEALAALADGHITIFRFTTHWKIQLGTPDLTAGDGREEVAALPAYTTLPEAVSALAREHGQTG